MTIGIICAMPEEAQAFLAASTAVSPDRDGFTRGKLDGTDIIIASSGLGKVRAAMSASALIQRWHCRALVSAGTAGGLGSIEPMRVVVGSELLQHDYGRSLGAGELELYRPGVPPLPDYRHIDPALTLPGALLERFEALAREIEYVEFGKFASGDTFVNDLATKDRLKNLGAIAVDMECSAVAQVAEAYSVPWMVAKGISDDASTMSHEAFLEGLAEASRRSAMVVAALLQAL